MFQLPYFIRRLIQFSLLPITARRFDQKVICTLLLAVLALARAQYAHPSQFRSQAVVNTGFIPSIRNEDKLDDSTPSGAINYRQVRHSNRNLWPTQSLTDYHLFRFRTRVPHPQQYEYEEEEEAPRPTVPTTQIRRQQPTYIRQSQQPIRQSAPPPNKQRFEEELEAEEPDRLAIALEKSTFQCEGRTG